MKPFDTSDRVWNFLAALSLANVCFLSVWREVIFIDAANSYWVPDYTLESYLAIMINVFAIALIAYGLTRIEWLDSASTHSCSSRAEVASCLTIRPTCRV